MALYADPSTGALLVNADGSIFDTDDETLAACCCDDYYELNLNAILERQKAAGVTSGNLIDLNGTYTLAQLCAEANKFSGSSAGGVRWMALAGWSDKTGTPSYITDSSYFGITSSGATVEVADEEELYTEVVKFTTSFVSPGWTDSPSTAVAYEATYYGQEWEYISDTEWIDQEPWSDTKSGAEAAWGVDASPGTIGVYSALLFVGMNYTPTASALAHVRDDVGAGAIDTRIGRTLQLWIKGKAPTFADSNSFNAFGCGVGNGSYGQASSETLAASASNTLDGPRWSGYSGSPSWPSDLERRTGEPYPSSPSVLSRSLGWVSDGNPVVVIEWDFDY